MKKVLLSLLMVAALGVVTKAQTKDAIKIGVKAGVTFPTFGVSGSESEDENWKVNTSFYVGGTVDIPVSEMFSIQPGLSLIGKGAKSQYSESIVNYSYSGTDKLSTMYIEIPVNAVVSFTAGSGKIFIGAGPYYGMAISGKAKSEETVTIGSTTTTSSNEENIKFGKDKDFKRGDFGLNFLAGYQLSNGFNIHAGYGLGLSDISNSNSSSFKATNKVLSVGVGYSF